jgi:putative membrane protein
MIVILVLCVDRDDDLGRKTGIHSPIVGREENLKAVIALGTADPEEADTNAMFGAISIYDDLVGKGYETDVALICGSRSVGIESDRKLAKELEEVIERTKADEVFLVSDGAEDEYILPIITSRIKVASVRRIVVKQSKSIEDTYYVIKKFFEDEKTQIRLIVPVALVLLVAGLFEILNRMELTLLPIIAVLVGAYLMSNPMFKLLRYFWRSVTTGKVSFFMQLISVILLAGSFIYIYNSIVTSTSFKRWAYDEILSFVDREIVWVVIALATSGAGRVIEAYITEREVLISYWVFFFSIAAMWFIVLGSTNIIRYSIEGVPYTSGMFVPVIVEIALGIGIVVAGVVSYGYVRARVKGNKQVKE